MVSDSPEFFITAKSPRYLHLAHGLELADSYEEKEQDLGVPREASVPFRGFFRVWGVFLC
jgi:hypothetical protein